MAKIITVSIDLETGDPEVDLQGYKGKGCHAVQEAFQKGYGGTSKKLVKKPEFNQVVSGTVCITK
jgi:hypothetical protein